MYVSDIDGSNDSHPEGQFVTSFGRGGNGPGEFSLPAGLVLDSSGVLYVCDRWNNRIQLF